ncbi:MAG: hypothetical protein HY710_09465 [Candidatus Latescibacteria bacterium]|nr:hypothetical protein [Candidatus Latescibacterota bacterium]
MAEIRQGREPGLFEFETADLRGVLQADGTTHGIRSLVHRAYPEQDLINPHLYALNLYRLLAADALLGAARTTPHKSRLIDGGVEVTWTPAPGCAVAIRTRYEVKDPNIIDLMIVLRTDASYPAFELFVASYFVRAFVPHVFVRHTRHEHDAGTPILVRPAVNDTTQGCYHAFPRDAASARLFYDGRWEHGPHPIHFTATRHYAYPIGLYADPASRLACAIFAQQDDCFGIDTTYAHDDSDDDVAAHNSLYFSLFGQDTSPGWMKTTRLRLVLTEVTGGFETLIQQYEQFDGQGSGVGGQGSGKEAGKEDRTQLSLL